jgi:hypothetical protein
MAAWLPLPSGFTGYATRFVDPALGFSLGWNYWFKVSKNDDLIYKATRFCKASGDTPYGGISRVSADTIFHSKFI